MARTRSVDFLPQIFQTDANKQFLAATLDTLIQEPKFKKTQGFIGRTVGPGVNPNDKYVIELNKTRADYQLEPGVVNLKADTNEIKNTITYPGMSDAISFQGGDGTIADRLYESDYYTWDPFVSYDSFVNFSQYYWLPGGPDAVDVGATGVAITNNITVTRENGVYTFSGSTGNNPTLSLVRGGNYTFTVAQNAKETVNYRVSNSGTSAYTLDFKPNPTETLVRGNTYVFNLSLTGVFPFWIKTALSLGTADAYNSGVVRNGSTVGLITFTVPQDAPDTLYYAAENQSNMRGTFNIVDGDAGTGPGFWIQTNPGVSGRIPITPNISSRDVLGVQNNGEDLGAVVFNVPLKTAQQYYYDLPTFPVPVDFVTDLKFDEINNQRLDIFLAEQGGIDGNSLQAGQTLIFTNPITDANDGGWVRTTFFDPLEAGTANNGLTGSYDTTLYSQTTEIPPADRYQLWQISFVASGGFNYIKLDKVADFPTLNKFTVRCGNTYSSTNWYKDTTGLFTQIPLLTATLDTLYYQDGTDPEIFGKITLLDQAGSTTIFIEDIIGQKNYTSPNGVEFTNGLKVVFRGDVIPTSYSSGIIEFTCTGTVAGTNAIFTDSTDELYVGQELTFVAPTLGGLDPGSIYYVQSIINEFQFTVSSVQGGRAVTVTTATGTMKTVGINYREYYVAGVGTAIQLLPVTDFVVPESYAVDYTDSTILVEPNDPDYITIDRASQDLNPWTRSNRWFHVDVIEATAAYNKTVAQLDNNYRAKRPIIQFRPNIRLFNMGTDATQSVDVIDFNNTDAFSNIEGSTGYTVDGYTFINGTRVIFAADSDAEVRNKIWVVEFITPDSLAATPAAGISVGLTYEIISLGTTDWNTVAGTIGVTYSVGSTFKAAAVGTGTGIAGFEQPVIAMTLAQDGNVLVDQCTVCTGTNQQKGKSFWYDGSDWIEAQAKTSVQQPPRFNVYDSTGVSFSDQIKYPSSDFVGSKLFSYAIGDTGILDTVLKFPLSYLSIENVGDIVFDNNLYKDTFVYTRDNISVTLDISSGSVREYGDRTTYAREIGWQDAVTTTKSYQQFKFIYDGTTLKLDVKVNPTDTVPVLKVYVGSKFQDPTKYDYVTTANSTTITLHNEYLLGDIVEVLALSSQTSKLAFYQVPINLQNNPLNVNSPRFTLGTIRQHYQSICENLPNITGAISGANNTRDLGNIGPYGLIILQQSAPLTLAGYFLRSAEYNIFNSITYNSREYSKYKNQMLEAVTQQTISFQTASEILDTAIAYITEGRVESQSFYWSDMLPSGAVYTENNYTVSFITSNVFDTVQVYNYTSANYLGLSVYIDNRLLSRDLEYVVATDGPRVTITIPLEIGQVVTIREYSSTYGSFCPNTPSKLGLYPAYRPEVRVVKTSTGQQTVIIGHDGSTTKIFGDIRDEVLLEFETRIYNNLKLDGNPVPLTVADVLPGQFRNTGYNIEAINSILNTEFLSYVAWNKLDYKQHDYRADNEFTYNYSTATSKLNNDPLPGAWRGINRYYYDTEQPQDTPWEMVGFSVKPSWWDETYGTAPYTGENFVLWDDMEAGYVRDPVAPYTLPQYARPGLSKVIPTGSQGELLSPLISVVGSYDATQFRKSWSLDDGSPVEASWWNSSNYPFAVMRLLALTRPAKFFALFADRDLYRYNTEFGQYLYNNRYRLDATGVEVYGNGVSKASYIDWIVDYNRQSGLDSTTDLQRDLKNLDVRLCYRMASFSDKKYIKIYTEKSSPNSTNTSFLIPDESYNLVLYKNQPFDRANYSSVVIQQVPGGYSVFGYSTYQPYFNVLQSQITGKLNTITSGGVTVRVPTFYTSTVVQIPYGYIFSDITAVSDFLLSYGKYLESQGLTFTNVANGFELNWNQMVNEFLYWSQQGWDDNALIALNPLAFKLSITRPRAVVDSIQAQTSENILLDQNRRELPAKNLNITRIENTFTVTPTTDQSLSFIDLKYTSYEHMIVLDNVSVFGDLIYDTVTGARQSRLKLVAATSTDWNGSVDAQGFILNQDNVEEWTGLRTYAKGELVKYKDSYWSAAAIVQPSATFNFNNWLQSDYTQIELGLLPNIANKANQLANSYDINSANLEQDNDLLSYGLIGFRPRQYLASINLDDVSQVNVYRQFLGSKGTILAAELFKQIDLGKELADYQIYENWAVQRAVYGANANRSFFEIRLNRALLNASPSLVQVVGPQQTSPADQTLQVGEIWRQSYKITSPDILPVTLAVPTDTALPTAGYVNLEDIDITVFDLNNPASLEANINNIGVGTSIWVAKVNDYDWNIYRAETVPGTIAHVCDNLDGTSRVIFTGNHGLTAGERIIIRFFDSEVDGVYDVLSVSNLTTVNIAFRFTGSRTVVDGTGLAFTLQTMRVAQASDILNLPYANNITAGGRVWVDDDGTGRWVVLEKQSVFSAVSKLAPQILDATENYGTAIAQATDRFAAFVGSPRYGFGTGTQTGAVYVYVNNYSSVYQPISPVEGGDAILTLDADGVRNFGASVDFGGQAWAVAGAPGSLGSASQVNNGYVSVIYRDYASYVPGGIPYTNWQLLTTPGSVSADQGRFGAATVMSLDDRWMYVSAPDANKVYAYGRIEWQNQAITTLGDGSTTAYNIVGRIQINNVDQVDVKLNGALQIYGTDYTVDGSFTTVTFTTAPVDGYVVEIYRPGSAVLDYGEYYSLTATFVSGSNTGTTALFTVLRVRGTVQVGVQAGGTGYVSGSVYTLPAALFDGGTSPANDISFTIVAPNGKITSLTGVTYTAPTPLAGAVGNPISLNEHFFTVDNIYSFTLIVDDVIQRPIIDYTFNDTTKDLTFTAGHLPGYGANIVARAQSYFQYIGELPTAGLGLTIGDKFGSTISTGTDGRQVLVGAPDRTVDGNLYAGSVYVFDRNVQRFIYSTTSTPTFTLLGTIAEPVAVIVNNQFLVNENVTIAGAAGTFSVSGNTVTINSTLNVGDIIEIETNQFAFVQTVEQDTVAEFSNYGYDVDLCSYNCSLYVGAPQSSVQTFKGGVVERLVNQSRVYGTITSTIANPGLTAGNTIRINNIDVAVPVSPNQNVSGLAAAINTQVPNVVATVVNGYLQLTVANTDAAAVGDKLQVAPGTIGTTFVDLGFETFAFTQTILSPYPVDLAGFGTSISIDDTATTLVVGAPQGTMYLITIFDDGTTDFDAGATEFFTVILQSGTAYTYNLVNSANSSVANPGKFVFGDQISITTADTLDQIGYVVNYQAGSLWLGAPGTDIDDSSSSNYGEVYVWQNANKLPSWIPIHLQQPTVDIRLLNSVFLYDRITSATTEFLDFFNPLQGKILGAARQNIDYIGAVDPASYNSGPLNVRGTTWGAGHVGEVWWDISTVRFIDPNQDSIVYASRRWGQIFPGSTVDVYQWIVSDVPPSQYAGPGTPASTVSCSINTVLGIDGTFNTQYFYWVRGLTTVATQKGKTLSVATVATYIENPRATGIAYLAPINASTVALYNCETLIEASDTILNIEFDKQLTSDNVHVEYELIPQDRADGFLSGNLYKKLQDSFCGVDGFGNLVPDPSLSPAERYGVQFRPRQSMFVNRFTALKNYIVRANAVLAQYPVTENRQFTLLNSSEPLPSVSSGLWDTEVSTLEILSFQNIYSVPLGYTYLVDSDSNNQGRWTIYKVDTVATIDESFTSTGSSISGSTLIIGTVTSGTVVAGQRIFGVGIESDVFIVSAIGGTTNQWLINKSLVIPSTNIAGQPPRELVLNRVQNYSTPDYWSYINWYRVGYNSSIKPVVTVPNYSSLSTLDVPVGSSVQVAANAQGKFEIYLRTNLGWDRVGLQDGTIEISAELYDYALGRFGFDVEVFDAQYFDQEPVIETRKIIQAINEELFVDDLEIERNKSLVLMFNYVLSEFSAPEWLVKTSLVDVDHKIRELLPFQNYSADNQEFVVDYFQEVKPYHVTVREFNLKYFGSDEFFGDLTDFDLPAYYNTELSVPRFTSPILTPYAHATNDISNTLSDQPATAQIWTEWPYNQWIENYLMLVGSIYVTAFGTNYTEPPVVVINGDAATPATAQAVINSSGQVVAVTVITQGSGYRSQPTVTFLGGNGSGARAYVNLVGQGSGRIYNVANPETSRSYTLTRSFDRIRIKYDRYQYQTSVLTWNSGGTYENGTLVRYENAVWRADNSDGSSANVGPTFNLQDWVLVPASELTGVDRTMGYYVPGANLPGLELPLLVDGVEYPGVQVWGDYFAGVEVNDADYRSSFTDIYLGTRPTDINVNGGEFIGPYEGHAPEELVNGSEYDTLDMRVYTRPGSDWQFDGHGFQITAVNYIYNPFSNYILSYAGQVEHPVEIIVSNQTTGRVLTRDVDYFIDWANQDVEVVAGKATAGDVINISVYELGGGTQLWRANYNGAELLSGVFYAPVSSAEINSIAVFFNGELTAEPSWEPYFDAPAWNLLAVYPINTVVTESAAYYVSIQAVPQGTYLFDPTTGLLNTTYWEIYVPTQLSKVTLAAAPTTVEGIAVVIFGTSVIPAGNFVKGRTYTIVALGTTNFTSVGAASNTVGVTFVATGEGSGTGTASTNYSWSTAQTQTQIVTPQVINDGGFELTNYMAGTNPANIIVTVNGLRLTPPAGIEWIGDDSSVSFGLPQRLGASFLQSAIDSINDIQVWVDSVLQVQSFGAVTGDYSVTNWDGSNTPGRQVVFNQPPPAGARILISVSTLADYTVFTNNQGPQLSFVSNPALFDTVVVTSWNDTSQQNLLTLVFVGPVVTGTIIDEPYDSTDFDAGLINNGPGTFDYSTGASVSNNQFYLERPGVTGNRLWVSLNGIRQFEGQDFTIVNDYIILALGSIGVSDIFTVTEFSQSIVPEACAFRIFQDMRGVQATYRITESTTTTLASDLSATADIIYVTNAAALSEPNLVSGRLGVITIDGERIMYRVRNVATNTLSDLYRGTAGTAAADHNASALVYDIGRGNLLAKQYQDYVITDTSVGDGTTIEFTAPNLTIVDFGDSAGVFDASIEVYVGGTRQYPLGTTACEYPYTFISNTPVTIEFYTNTDPVNPVLPPPDGVEVTMVQRRGTGWYGTGVKETTGFALQETDTPQARFLTGR
jgi:hypothetical protein